MFKIKI